MMLDVARCLVSWLQDGTYGVAALLAGASVARDVGDPLPTIATITDEFSDKRVAAGRLPELLPALVVDVAGVSVVENQVVMDQGDGQIVARVRYGAAGVDLAAAKEAGSYVMRAVAQSIRILNRQQHEAARTRNSIRFRPASNGAVDVRPYLETIEDTVVTGLCVVTYDLRDFATLPP